MTRKYILASFLSSLLIYGCVHSEQHNGTHEGHSHEAHNHEAHNHEAHNHEAHNHETHNHEEHDHENHEGHSHDAQLQQSSHSDEIVMSVEKARNAGVMVEKADKMPFRSVIQTSGHLIAAQGDEAAVVASMTGIVNISSPVTEGMKVEKGDVLFTISANKLQDGDPAEKARVAYEVAKEEYERMKGLLDDKLVTLSAYNAAKEKYETARIAYDATASNGKEGLTVKAPISGYVRNCNVSPGDYVSTGQLLADIANNNRLYLQADLPLRYYKDMDSITEANFSTDYSDEVFNTSNLNGKVLSFGKTVSEASAFIPVTFEIDHSNDLIAGSFAKVSLLTNEKPDVISLPVSAITEEQGVYFVYIQDDATCYHKQEVKLGMNNGKRVAILSGLHGGENVVTKGAIHVRLASANNSIPHGHNHSH